MNVRVIAVAAGLVLAAACRTGGSQSSGGAAQAPSSGAQGSQAASGGAGQAGQDPLVEKGPEVKAHASDRIVSGEIGQVSPESLTVRTDQGDSKVLELVGQTEITLDGEDASYVDLQEGQQVKASFSDVNGREVAVKVEAERFYPANPSSSQPGTGSIPEPPDQSPGDASGSGSAGDRPEPGAAPQPVEEPPAPVGAK